MKDADKFVIAVKDSVTQPGHIRPGRILARRRKRIDADKDSVALANRQGIPTWHVSVFHHGKLLG